MPRHPPRPPNERLLALLDEADDAFEAGEPARALERADEALLLEPRSVDALHYRAAALTALDRLDEALDAYRLALKAGPDDLELLRSAIDLLIIDLGSERESLEEGLKLARDAVRLARKKGPKDLLVELLMLSGIGLGKLGDPRAALQALDEAGRLAPKSGEVALERGIALFELLRLDDARAELERSVGLGPDEGWAHHYLALIAERRGESEEARRQFAQAAQRNPEDFPPSVELSPESFDQAVHDALDDLPAKVRADLKNVSISVRELPSDEQLGDSDPPLSPDELLGLIEGPDIVGAARGAESAFDAPSTTIFLFQKNLERSCRSREELLEQIGITVVHELGHFLGLSEDELYERGLD